MLSKGSEFIFFFFLWELSGDTIKNCKAKALVVVGEKENSRMKKSAEMIHKVLEGSVLKILPGLYHGEFSINHGAEYAAEIEKLLKE